MYIEGAGYVGRPGGFDKPTETPFEATEPALRRQIKKTHPTVTTKSSQYGWH